VVAGGGAEVDGESAQGGLGPAYAASGAVPGVYSPLRSSIGRGRRQRKPSAKQAAAEEQQQAAMEGEEEEEAERRPSARELRADKRHAAAAVEAAGALQAAAVERQQPGSQQAVIQPAKASPSKTTARMASAMRQSSAAAASKLSSPQKGGVQKRASPTKPANPIPLSPRKAERCGAASRKQALVAAAAAKASFEGEPLPLAPGSASLLQRAARVIKSGVAEGVAKLRPNRQTTAARGLQANRMAS
jgi:hypothetical protein